MSRADQALARVRREHGVPEIHELHVARLLAPEHNVFRLDIRVDVVELVHVLQRLQAVPQDVLELAHRELPLLGVDVLVERRPETLE